MCTIPSSGCILQIWCVSRSGGLQAGLLGALGGGAPTPQAKGSYSLHKSVVGILVVDSEQADVVKVGVQLYSKIEAS